MVMLRLRRAFTKIAGLQTSINSAHQNILKRSSEVNGRGGDAQGFADSPRGGTALRLLVSTGVVGVGCATWGLGEYFRMFEDPHERVWWGNRGPFSTDRAVAILPLLACCGSGAVAAAAASRFPAMARHITMPSQMHELLALPMSILLAFRFQNAYDRWWVSRQEMETLAANAVTLALCASNNAEVDPNSREAKLAGVTLAEQQQHAEKLRRRMLSFIDAYCAIAEDVILGGLDPHPSNNVDQWLQPEEVMHQEDAEQCLKSKDKLIWCTDCLMDCIHASQRLGLYSAELASKMYDTVGQLHDSVQKCEMVRTQRAPVPFVVHVRTLLFAWCYTFPFTLVGVVRPFTILPAQFCLSFAYLGAEFCSAEMQDPFGNDADDVPARRILQGARHRVRALLDGGVGASRARQCGISAAGARE